MSQLSAVMSNVRNAVLKKTAGETVYSKSGMRPCTVCSKRFNGRSGDYWCDVCYKSVTGYYKHNDVDGQKELARQTSTGIRSETVVDENGKETTFAELSKRYRAETIWGRRSLIS